MSPPVFAQALVAAAAPASDYEVIAGDLHEEYLRVLHLSGTKAANRWYWAQALLSIAPLLSYSRSNNAVMRQVTVAFISLAVLVAMFVVALAIDTVALTTFASICLILSDAVVFGAILAWLVRSDGLRVAFFAALFLVLCFVVPALAGHPGSQAPFPAAWIALFAVIPAMCAGAGLYQITSRRKNA